MVKYSEILKAINKKIKEKFPEIEIQTKDISEGFNRPSFFVDFEDLKSNDMMDFYRSRKTTISIYYFPRDRYKNRIELIDTQDGLEEIFSDMLVVRPEFVITLNEAEARITDGVLIFSFDLDTVEEIDREDSTPLMEVLDIERKEV